MKKLKIAGYQGDGSVHTRSVKFFINKVLVGIPLIITYLIGPLGIFIYWLIRIFYAKSINLYE